MALDDLDTLDQQQDDADAKDADAQNQDTDDTHGDADGDQDADQPFLRVDDRTVYKTPEDAIKGFSEAGKRIAQLSKWEKTITKEFGIADPAQAAELLRELAARRQGKWKDDSNQRTDDSRSTDRGADPNKPDPYAGLTPEEVKSAKWLESKGWMRKEAIEKLFDERIGKLREEFSNQLTERDENAVLQTRTKEGLTVLADLLKEAGLPNTPKHVKAAELYLTDTYFGDEADPEKERYNAFIAGGDSLKRVLADGFKTFLDEVITPMRTKQDASYEKKKTDAINRGGRPLPRNDGSGSRDDKGADKKKLTPGSNKAFEDAHEKAFKLFQDAEREK